MKAAITEVHSSGKEGYDFNVGDIYNATASDIEFELKVKEVEIHKVGLEIGI